MLRDLIGGRIFAARRTYDEGLPNGQPSKALPEVLGSFRVFGCGVQGFSWVNWMDLAFQFEF